MGGRRSNKGNVQNGTSDYPGKHGHRDRRHRNRSPLDPEPIERTGDPRQAGRDSDRPEEEDERHNETRIVQRIVREGDELKELKRRLMASTQSWREKIRKLCPDDRRKFFSVLYTGFAPTYDRHMETTRHYHSIRQNIGAQGRHLRLPFIDTSAGTAAMTMEIIKLFLEAAYITARMGMRDELRVFRHQMHLFSAVLENRMMELPSLELPRNYDKTPMFVLNDNSPGMVEQIRARLERFVDQLCVHAHSSEESELRDWLHDFLRKNVEVSCRNIEDLPYYYPEGFACAFCSQTMHVTPEREQVAQAIFDLLRPGGILLSIEEFEFFLSDTPYINVNDIKSDLNDTVIPMEGKLWFFRMMEEHGLYIVNGSESRFDIDGNRRHMMYAWRFARKGELDVPATPDIWMP